MNLDNSKIKHLKNFEEYLGIDLLVLFRAMATGFHYWNPDISRWDYFEPGKKKEYAVLDYENKCIYIMYESQMSGDRIEHFIWLCQYGKTWALTRGELA